MTNPGRDMEKYKESSNLKRARSKAAWKRVQALANAEKKLWHTKLHEAASKRDWRAYRAHKQLLRTREWEHYLLDDANWQGALKTHFEGIFKKEEADTVARHLAARKDQLARSCKTTRWIPFTIGELQVTQAKWPRRKAAGPDGIVHEAMKFSSTAVGGGVENRVRVIHLGGFTETMVFFDLHTHPKIFGLPDRHLVSKWAGNF